MSPCIAFFAVSQALLCKMTTFNHVTAGSNVEAAVYQRLLERSKSKGIYAVRAVGKESYDLYVWSDPTLEHSSVVSSFATLFTTALSRMGVLTLLCMKTDAARSRPHSASRPSRPAISAAAVRSSLGVEIPGRFRHHVRAQCSRWLFHWQMCRRCLAPPQPAS